MEYVKEIKGVSCCGPQAIYQIDSRRIIVGNEGGFCVVDIMKGEILNKVNDKAFGFVTSFIMLRDVKTLLGACLKGNFCLYDIETNEYKIQIVSLRNLLLICLHLRIKWNFLSCSLNGDLILWKY